MKNFYKFFVISFILIIILSGCDSKRNSEEKSNKVEEKEELYTFDNLKKDLMTLDNNLEVNKKAASMVGATEGYGYIMADCSLEAYKFDQNDEAYKIAEDNQELSMPSFETTLDAVVKNGYAYFVNDGTCDNAIEYVNKLN